MRGSCRGGAGKGDLVLLTSKPEAQPRVQRNDITRRRNGRLQAVAGDSGADERRMCVYLMHMF